MVFVYNGYVVVLFWSRVSAYRAFCARSERVGVSVSVRMECLWVFQP